MREPVLRNSAASRGIKAIATAAATGVLLTGCVSVQGSAGDYSLAEQFRYLPAPETDAAINIYATDYRRVGEILDDPRPDGEADDEELADWLRQASHGGGSGLEAFWPTHRALDVNLWSSEQVQEELGFSLRHVEQFTEMYGDSEQTLVFNGPYDAERLEDAAQEAGPGRWVYPDGSQYADYGLVEGSGGQLLLHGPQVNGEAVADGAAAVLAEDDEAMAAALALDSEPWYTVMMFRYGGGDEDVAFSWAGYAVDVDADDRHTGRIVYASADPDRTEDYAEQLQQVVWQGTEEGGLYAGFLDIGEMEVSDDVVILHFEKEAEAELSMAALFSRFDPIFGQMIEPD